MTRIAAACELTFDQLIAPTAVPIPSPPPDFVVTAVADVDAMERLTLTDEAFAIARLFSVAHTEVRIHVKQLLRDHVTQRTDSRARRVVQTIPVTVLGIVTPPSAIASVADVPSAPVTLTSFLLRVLQATPEQVQAADAAITRTSGRVTA